jgi:hypothetical protein
MFADPAVVAVNGSNKSLVRINQDKYSSEYLLRSSTDEYRLFIRNSSRFDKRVNAQVDRHNAEFIHTVFPTSTTPLIVRRQYVVIENQQGDTLADPTYTATGLLAFLTASSAANITKMLNSES